MKNLTFFLLIFLIFSCKSEITNEVPEAPAETPQEKKRAKFEPADGEVILFVGQELDAVGGLEEYNDGYYDHFDTPGGFTMYTKIRPGDESFGFKITGLCGVFSTDDWGDGNSNMSLQVADEDFKHSALAIGFEFFNHDKALAAGEHDSLVIQLGEWIQSLSPRPVFLRIGYEFGGSWNGYDRKAFIAAYRRMKDMYDEMGIDNIAYVWQSHGWEEPMDHLEAWYPGDEYVDWCGHSHFARWEEVNMIEFARKKGKPVFIAEATPTLGTETITTNGKTKPTDLSNEGQAKEAWDEWFVPFFKTIDDNPDVVKAISYINANWKSRPMWKENPTFQDIDARLHLNEEIANKWRTETSKEKYLKSSPGLFDYLYNNSK
ncbi:MAG: glycosyl hydrolase [Bacteroidota bacterium]